MAHRNALGRREFLKRVAGAAVVGEFPYVVSSSALGNADRIPPSERITMGCIGVGWQGGSNMTSFFREKDCEIVAICDVDKNHLKSAFNRVIDQNKNCAVYADYRELLERKIRFNPKTEEIRDDQTATSLLGKSMRSPWHV